MYGLWKLGLPTQEDYRGIVHHCREKILKTKAHVELYLASTAVYKKKGFLRIC